MSADLFLRRGHDDTPERDAFAIVAHALGVTPAHIAAVIEVEAAGRAFDARGRLTVLFEPHLFWRHLGPTPARRQAEAAGLAHPTWRRDYPKDSYPRLLAAMEIDRDAALRSASYGAPQILGQHAEALGYGSAENMVRAFTTGMDEQLVALARFIVVNNLLRPLQRGDWAGFARGYNGPSYAANRYHTKLESAFQRWRKANLPSIERAPAPTPDRDTVRRVQQALIAAGHVEVGAADGVFGPRTHAAVTLYRWRAGVGRPEGGIDTALMEALLGPSQTAPEPVEKPMQITIPSLEGRKTYLVALTLIVLVVIEKALGVDIPGFDVGDDWLLVILNALGLGALRHGIRHR
jgi:hypothetical protein